MPRRPFNFAAATSTVLLLATVALWVFSYQLPPSPTGFSHITPDGLPVYNDVSILAYRGQLSLYNHYLPYSGSIIGPVEKSIAFDFAGIYFRHFTHLFPFPTSNYWTLTVPLLHFSIVFSLLPLLWIALNTRLQRPKPGHCPHCNYDLRATPSRCPECGTAR